jgi:hypothetical protein
MTIICKKGAQDFHRALSKVFDRVKSVALWSAYIRKTPLTFYRRCFSAVLEGNESLDLVGIYFSTNNLNK